MNESFQPAAILEVVFYDWSRGSGYTGSYSATGTSSSGSAERRAEAGELGPAAGRDSTALSSTAPGAGGAVAGVSSSSGGSSSRGRGARDNDNGNEQNGEIRGPGSVVPIVVMDECPCDPSLLFRDGDVHEEEEEPEGDGRGVGDAGDLVLVRRDGNMVHGHGVGGSGSGEGVKGAGMSFGELFSAGELARDVGGLDEQLEDITRRVLSTRSLPSEVIDMYEL